MNKILLQYYCSIFKSSLGYRIFKGNIWLIYAPEFQTFFRRHKRRILCCRTSCYQSWKLYFINGMSVGTFPKFLDIYSNSFIHQKLKKSVIYYYIQLKKFIHSKDNPILLWSDLFVSKPSYSDLQLIVSGRLCSFFHTHLVCQVQTIPIANQWFRFF